MASVTLMLKENKANAKGEFPLYIRIIKGRKAKFISLGIRVHPDLWNAEKLRVKGKYKNSGRVNAYIATKVAEAENIAISLETNEKYISSKKIKEAIKGKEPASFIKFVEQYMAELKAKGKIGTYDKVSSTLLKLKKYLGSKDLSFDEFDLAFLKRYDAYMREDIGNSPNTIHGNLKIFRKVFNDAIREDIVKTSPFSKFKLAWEKTKKEYLTEEELKKIEELPLTLGTMMYHHRNMYIFASYAGGIRISDLLKLKLKNFDGTHISITTQKTGEHLTIKLPNRAKEIINLYWSENVQEEQENFIFPIFSNAIDYNDPIVYFKAKSGATAYANKNLKLIAEKAGINKKISFHSSRHTWATRALKKGMRIEYVSKIMGHNTIKTTQVYTKIVNAELDSAMDIFN